MKKIYLQPEWEVILVQTQQMLAASNVYDQTGNGTQLAPEMDNIEAFFKD